MNMPAHRNGPPSFPFAQSRMAENGHTRKTFRWWYDAIIDWMLANPGKTQADCAKHFGKHANTISLIVNSDLFRARFAQRRSEMNEDLREEIIHKTAKVAAASLDLMHARLTENAASIPLSLANNIMSTTLERLGFGAPQVAHGPQVNVQVNVPVAKEVLEEARGKIRQAEQSKLLEHTTENKEAAE